MGKNTRFVGLGVSAKLIAVAVADGGRDGEVRSYGTMPNGLVPQKSVLSGRVTESENTFLPPVTSWPNSC